MLRRQYELVEDGGSAVMIVWLPVDSRLKRNARITLKEIPDVVWKVTEVFATEMGEEYFHRKWNFDA